MPDFTELELAILDAIADEVADTAPELPGQIADAEVVDRADTGSGFLARIHVDRDRAAPVDASARWLGSIHADVDGLSDPVGFRAAFRDGFLIALEADAYGQDTTGVDFTTTPFSGLFRLTPEGRSVAVEPPRPRVESPLRRLQRADGDNPLFPTNAWRQPSASLTPGGSLSDALHQAPEPDPEPRPPLRLLLGAVDLALFAAIVFFALEMHLEFPGPAAALARLGLHEGSWPILIALLVASTAARWLLRRPLTPP